MQSVVDGNQCTSPEGRGPWEISATARRTQVIWLVLVQAVPPCVAAVQGDPQCMHHHTCVSVSLLLQGWQWKLTLQVLSSKLYRLQNSVSTV